MRLPVRHLQLHAIPVLAAYRRIAFRVLRKEECRRGVSPAPCRHEPPEERGTRAEWARRTGWHRREDTRRRAV